MYKQKIWIWGFSDNFWLIKYAPGHIDPRIFWLLQKNEYNRRVKPPHRQKQSPVNSNSRKSWLESDSNLNRS